MHDRTRYPGRWVAPDDVVQQIADRLDTQPDYITLSGSGEPTLYERIEELINRIKAITDVPVAVLTNGSLLWQPRVRRQLLAADLIIPSLDAGDAETFAAISPDVFTSPARMHFTSSGRLSSGTRESTYTSSSSSGSINGIPKYEANVAGGVST